MKLEHDMSSDKIKQHPSYEQVMLDVNRCAGRLEHIRQVYFHRTDDDEPPEDLTEELEIERNNSQATDQSTTADDAPDDSGQQVVVNKDAADDDQPIDDDDDDGVQEAAHLKEMHSSNQRELKRKLAELIVKLLIKKPDLHYYQGFHDVCLTYMTLLGDQEAYVRLDSVIDSHFKTFMQPTMNETQEFLALIPMIIGLHEPDLQDFLERSEVGTIFALSWVITWFSHVIPCERDVEQIFKFLEKNDPHMVLYLCAEIVLYKQDRLVELEPEMSTVHHFLCQVPRKEKLPLDKLMARASHAFSRWNPDLVKQKLDNHRKAKFQVNNYNLFQSTLSNTLGPALSGLVSINTRTAIIVLVLASTIALQIDRWTR